MEMTEIVKRGKTYASPRFSISALVHWYSFSHLLFFCSGVVSEPKSQVETSRKNGH